MNARALGQSITQQDARVPRVRLAVMQPTPFCNIDCKYCYLAGRHLVQRMSWSILERASRFLLEDPKYTQTKLVIIWHAGEPLVVPIEFYDAAFRQFDTISAGRVTVEHWFQTNGTLISQQWCDFAQRWRIRIGVSVDGPEWLHNLHRVNKAGHGTFAEVIRGINLLRSNKIAFSTIGVLSETSLEFPDEMWHFYSELGAEALALNFEDIEGVHATTTLQNAASDARAMRFFERLLYLRDREGPAIFVRELDSLLQQAKFPVDDPSRLDNEPLSIINISWRGEVSTFSPELLGTMNQRYGAFSFGHVGTDSLESMLLKPKLRQVFRDISAGVGRCRKTCEYFQFCGGGQPSNKLSENGTFDSTETTACQLRIKALVNVVLPFLEEKYGLQTSDPLPIRERVARISAATRLKGHQQLEPVKSEKHDRPERGAVSTV